MQKQVDIANMHTRHAVPVNTHTCKHTLFKEFREDGRKHILDEKQELIVKYNHQITYCCMVCNTECTVYKNMHTKKYTKNAWPSNILNVKATECSKHYEHLLFP